MQEHDAIAQAASLLGRLGGQQKTKAKKRAARANGKLGGRPRTYSKCPLYGSHRFAPRVKDPTLKCPCGKVKPKS